MKKKMTPKNTRGVALLFEESLKRLEDGKPIAPELSKHP